MSLAVFTCITDNYDSVKIPQVDMPEVPFFCFTDSPSSIPQPWIARPLVDFELKKAALNRYLKMHAHLMLPEFETTVYIDGSIQILGGFEPLIKQMLSKESELFLFQHPARTCTYLEAIACAHHGYEWAWVIERQTKRYAHEGLPINYGLYQGNIIIRRNRALVNTFMEQWWQEYSSGVRRDQLALPYVQWKTGFKIHSLGKIDFRLKNEYFRVEKHLSESRYHNVLKKTLNRLILYLQPSKRHYMKTYL